jgi:putative ABC transport system permease protein
MPALLQDLRFGARMLRNHPGFALAAILTLALGIGGNTAIFTVTSSVLLKALPYQQPEQLYSLDLQSNDGQSHCCSLNLFDLFHDNAKSFTAVAAAAPDNFNLTGRGEPVQVAAGRVSPDFFAMLGVKPHSGRLFLPEDGHPESKPVVVLSNSFWHTRFGGDQSIVGQTIALDSTPHTVIGILPAGLEFPFLGPADLWTPRYFEYSLFSTQRLRMGVGYLAIVGRLRPGASLDRALAEMNVLQRQFEQEHHGAPDARPDVNAVLTGLQESVVGGIRDKLKILSVFVGLVLLIACANVASLLLSRALSRKKEIAVRAALGASRSALVRQLLTESVLLAFVGGAVGLGLAWAAIPYLVLLGKHYLPQGIPIAIDGRVLFFVAAISVLTGLLFGLFPALQLSRTNMNQTLRDEGRGTTGGHRRMQLRGLMVIGQVAISLVVVIGAGLLVRSFIRLLTVDPGFDPRNVLTMNVSLPNVRYADPAKQVAFFDELLRRLSTTPGIQSAAISATQPLTWKRITPVLPEGQPEVPLPQRPFIDIEAISPQWFHTLRVPIISGREFTDADNAQAPKVLIVNQTFAKKFWPNENPVGKRIVMGRGPAPSEVVGVAADVKNRGLAQDPQAQIYFPFSQIPWGNMYLIIRTGPDPSAMVPTVRAQIAAIDPDQPVTAIETANELMDEARAQSRLMVVLVGVFCVMALVLASIGIYGVLAYSVEQRRQELGIRVALGAVRSDIFRLVAGYGLLLAAIGIVLGLVGSLILSWALASTLSGVLYKVSVRDVLTFVGAPTLFLIISLVASYLPARRAMKVDPNEALRSN